MRRLVIAVDCDDVLVATVPFFVDTYNKKYGTAVELEYVYDEHYKGWGVDHATMLERFAELLTTDEYKALGPTEEEKTVLTELAQHHELHVVTSRRPEEVKQTQYMLDRDLPGVFSSLELVGFHGSKGEVCARIGADVLIDDNLRHLQNAVEHGLSESGAILYGAYPWNSADITPTDFVRCHSWREVAAAIERIAAQKAEVA